MGHHDRESASVIGTHDRRKPEKSWAASVMAAALEPLRLLDWRRGAAASPSRRVPARSAPEIESQQQQTQTGSHADPYAVILPGLRSIPASAIAGTAAREDYQAMLLTEVHHRVANSLQLIASILSIKSAKARSEETQLMVQDVLNRLMLVAAVERQLCALDATDEIVFAPYLAQLCARLTSSMIAGDGRIAIISVCSEGRVKSDDAASIGMIVTELVMNALKHAFPDGRKGIVNVEFAASGQDWRLTVVDDGIGPTDQSDGKAGTGHSGVGTKIVQALARHLNATVEISGKGGTTTAIVCATQKPKPP